MRYYGPEDNGDNDDDDGETDEFGEGVGEITDSDNGTDPHEDSDYLLATANKHR